MPARSPGRTPGPPRWAARCQSPAGCAAHRTAARQSGPARPVPGTATPAACRSCGRRRRVLPAHTKAHLYFCDAQRTEHSFGQSARTFEHGAEDLQRDLCLFARLGGLVCLGGSGGGLLRAFSSAFFRLRSARHAANFALTLPKPLGGAGFSGAGGGSGFRYWNTGR